MNPLFSKEEPSAALWNARFLPGFKCQAKVADWLIKTASQRRLGCLSAFTFTFTAVKGLCLCRACNLSNYQLGKKKSRYDLEVRQPGVAPVGLSKRMLLPGATASNQPTKAWLSKMLVDSRNALIAV